MIVVDTSGSMGEGSRVQMAKDAVKKVVDTLSWTDYATVVTFGSSATAASSGLHKMDSSAKSFLKRWADTNVHSNGGGTNFRAAFNAAFGVFRTSDTSSGSECEKVILFMTDGASTDYSYDAIQSDATSLGVRIFSYTLGDGAQQTVPKRIACENGGVFQHIPDCGDLAGAMAGYFKVLAAGTSKIAHPQPRWVHYFASSTGEEVLSGCLPVFKDEGQAPGQVRELLGATCIDLNVIVPISTLRSMECWTDFWGEVVNETQTCTRTTLTEAELESLRVSRTCGCLETYVPRKLRHSNAVAGSHRAGGGVRALAAGVRGLPERGRHRQPGVRGAWNHHELRRNCRFRRTFQLPISQVVFSLQRRRHRMQILGPVPHGRDDLVRRAVLHHRRGRG